MSRRFLALLFFLAVSFGIFAPLLRAQSRRNTQALPGNQPRLARPGFGVQVPRRFLMPRDARSVGSDVTRRSTEGVTGFNTTRAFIGGAGGGNVPEQVVNITQNPLDDILPFWTNDESFIYFSSNRDLGRYQLFRVDANASSDVRSPAPAAATRLTNDAGSDFLFPSLNVNSTRIAFLRSTDAQPVGSAGKRFDLYVANVPSSGFIDLTPAGGLISLTAGRTTGFIFDDVQRPSWLGSEFLVFSGRLQAQTNYHIFRVNITSGLIQQLTDGPASELNTIAAPNGLFIAFDSNATGYAGGGTPRDLQNGIAGNPANATGTAADRNVFIVSDLGAGAIRFTNAPGSHVQPSWSALRTNNRLNPAGQDVYITFASTRRDVLQTPSNPASPITSYTTAATTDIYYVRALNPLTNALFTESAPGGGNPARKLNTSDPNYEFNDEYPFWSPFTTILRICHQSDRSGTLRNDAVGLPFARNFTKTPGVHDLFISTVIDINAPTLLRYDTTKQDGEIVHVNLGTSLVPSTGASVRTPRDGVVPGGDLFFTVRVEDRESGMQPEKADGGRGAVFIVLKNPNSKYQQNSGVEHKEWTQDGNSTISPVTVPTNVPAPFTIDVAGSPTTPSPTSTYYYGHEYEAQPISAANPGNYWYHTRTNTYDPITGAYIQGTVNPDVVPRSRFVAYTASIDDASAFSGIFFPPQDGGTYNGTTTPSIWLELKRLPDADQDNQGGILYGATWRTPSQGSDWYMDVVAYDNAVNPYNVGQRFNWIIYDNVWGFSTYSFAGVENILVVSDYALGQKFYNVRFGIPANSSSNNLTAVFWGSESYFTDVDMGRDPKYAPPSGTGSPYRPYVQNGAFQISVGGGPSGGLARGLVNPLGVNSYTDQLNADNTTVDGRPLPPTGRYEIWRILSRGPVPQDVFTAYLPQPAQTTPPDLRVGETQTRTVRSIERMIVWNSPFSGDLFVGPGAITDRQAQTNLTNFVNAGGQLFISGQDIGFAMVTGQYGPAFFSGVLKAQLTNDEGGAASLTATVIAGQDNSVADDPWTRARHAYGRYDANTPYPRDPLTSGAIPVSSASGPRDASRSSASGTNARLDVVNPIGNAYTQFNYSGGGSGIITSAFTSGGRVAYSSLGFESIGQEWYEVSNAIYHKGRRAEIMHNITCGFRTGTIVGRILNASQGGSPVADALVRAIGAGGEGQAAVVTAATDANGNYRLVGLKPDNYVIYAYRRGFTIQHTAGITVHGAYRTQTNLSLTEAPPGSLTGKVFRSDGTTPLSGIEVQVRAQNPADLSFFVLRTTSGADGSYTIPGIPIGFYEVVANPSNVDAGGNPIPDTDPRFNRNYNPNFATVFVRDPSQTDIRLGAGTNIQNGLVEIQAGVATQIDFILAAPPQPVTGRVVDQAGTPIPGATVTATEGGQVVAGPVTTDAQGAYSLPALEGTITITAVKAGYTDGSITVAVGGVGTFTAPDIVLTKVPPGSLSGLVTEFGTNTPIEGATVQLLFQGAVVATTTTGPVQTVDGYTFNYRFDNVEAGTYVVRVSKEGYFGSQPSEATATVTSATETRGVNFQLFPPGSVSGTVTLATGNSGAPVAGATVRIFRSDTLALVKEAVSFVPLAVAADGYTFNYRIDGVPAGTYVVQVFKEGLTSDPVQIAVTVNPAAETRNVNFRLLPLKVYGPGLQLISTPFDYSDRVTRTVFGLTPDQPAYNVFNVAEWLPQQDDYLIGPDIRLALGKGYFVRLGDVASVQIRGSFTGPSTGFDLPVAAGWNLIGNPFDPAADVPNDGSLDLTRIIVIAPSLPNPGRADGTYTIAEAAAAGLVRDVVFSYTGSQTGSQYVQGTILKPWVGYWFRAFAPVTLRMLPPSTTRSVSAAAASRATISRADYEKVRFRSINSKGLNDWRLQVAARQGDLLDTDNSIGVAPGAKDGWDTRFDTEKPPRLTQVPSLYIAFAGRNPEGRATALMDDIRSAEGGRATLTWEFTVAAGGEGEVTLTLPNVSRLPRKLVPILVDAETNRRVNLRSSPTYRYAPEGRSTHRFRIEVKPPISRLLAVTDVKVLRSGSSANRAQMSGYRFSFRTTQEANVQVEVQTLTGKSVRQLRTRALAVEESAVIWDGRGSSGEALPSGPYVLSLTARDDEGNVVRVQRPIISTR